MKNSNTLIKLALVMQLHLTRLVYNTFGRLWPNYFASRAFELWLTSPRFKMHASEQSAAHSARHESVKVNNLDIAVYIWPGKEADTDTGRTLLFIHGWSGRGTQVANYIEPLGQAGYRIVSFDAPAHGRTSGKQTSMLEFTDVVLALEKTWGPFDAALTHSLGGMVLPFAMSQGLAVKKAVCICPPDTLERLMENFQEVLAMPAGVRKAIERKSFAAYGQVTRDWINVLNNVQHLDCPALIIHDRDDNDTPVDSSEKIARAWPGAKLMLTDRLGHRRILHDEVVIKAACEFLSPH